MRGGRDGCIILCTFDAGCRTGKRCWRETRRVEGELDLYTLHTHTTSFVLVACISNRNGLQSLIGLASDSACAWHCRDNMDRSVSFELHSTAPAASATFERLVTLSIERLHSQMQVVRRLETAVQSPLSDPLVLGSEHAARRDVFLSAKHRLHDAASTALVQHEASTPREEGG